MHCAKFSHICFLAMIFALLMGLAAPDALATVSAYQITSPSDTLSGDYADGQVGDYMLENDLIAVVISDIGHIVDPAVSGGIIIDAGSSTDRVDALGELYPFFDADWSWQADYENITIIDDGSGSGPAVIQVSGYDSKDYPLWVTTEYMLADAAQYVYIWTLVKYRKCGTSVTDFELGDAFSWGECYKYVPGYGFSPSDTTWEPWLAGTAEQVSYGYTDCYDTLWSTHGNTWSDVNEVTWPFLSCNDSIATYHRWFIVGGRDIASVATVIHDACTTTVAAVSCTVSVQGSGVPISGAYIDVYDDMDDPYLQMETDPLGLAFTTLPDGDWRLMAWAWGYSSQEAELTVTGGDTVGHHFLLAPFPADTLTVIQRPLLNIPSLITPGDTLTIECEAGAGTSDWAAELIYKQTQVPLTVLSSSYDVSTLWWTIEAKFPAVWDTLYDLYDLVVTASGGIADTARNAVGVIREFKDEYYFIHITDPHLPTHSFIDETEYDPTDSTEIEDLRVVIDHINIINPQFVLLTGDLVNEGELEDYMDLRYYTRAKRLLNEFQVPVFLTSGNHDIGGWVTTPVPDGTARLDWWRFFGWRRLDDPPPGAPWRTQNYSFDYGPVHYVGMEAYENYDLWREEFYGDSSFTEAQLQWLDADLAASESDAQVLFYHIDYRNQIDLDAKGVEMALWGHIHHNQGSIYTMPYDLATDCVCDTHRAYRLIRVNSGTLEPSATLKAGSSGENLIVEYTPTKDGIGSSVTAEITNNHDERFEHAMLRFLMTGGDVSVAGGTLLQVDETDSGTVCYVGVDILPESYQTVTVVAHNPIVTVTFPNGGETLNHSTIITWSATDPDPGDSSLLLVDLDYSDNGGGSWTPIATGEANDGSYLWNIAGLSNGSNYLVRVTATDTSNFSGFDVSDSVFTIIYTGVWPSLKNPGFETWTAGAGGPPDYWSLSGSSITATRESGTVHNGSRSCNLTWTTTSNRHLFQDVDIVEDQDYEFGFWAYDNDPGGRARVSIEWMDPDTGLISGYYGEYTDDEAAWQQLNTGMQTAPAGAAFARVEIRVYDVSGWPGTATIYVDDASFTIDIPDTLLCLASDTTAWCCDVNAPDLSCTFKPGPASEAYEWTLPGYVQGSGWGKPLTEPEIGTWPTTPMDYPGVHWIWPRNSNGLSCEHAFFRHSFSISESTVVTGASLEMTVDNEYIVYLNGVELGGDGDCQDPYEGEAWSQAEMIFLDPNLFLSGPESNVLAIHGYNNYDIAGVRYRLLIGGIDVTAPDAIDDLHIALESGMKSTSGDIHLIWTEPFDDVGVARYVVYRSTQPALSGDSLAGTENTVYTDSGVAGTEGVNYFYVVKAVDCADNKSGESNKVGEFDIEMTNGVP